MMKVGRGGKEEGSRLIGKVSLARWKLLLAGMLIRVLAVLLGVYLDSLHLSWRYTDVDYQVYSDAAGHVLSGQSPYERPTYRYPPIIAQLLTLNWLLTPYWGKFLFSFFDTIIVIEILHINDKLLHKSTGESQEKNTAGYNHLIGWLWCLNPVSVYICSRGSCDAISNYVILLSLRLILQKQFALSGLVLGVAMYIRIYPIIYLPAFMIYAYYCVSRRESWWHGCTASGRVLICTITAGSMLALVSVMQYGEQYLEHGLFYHVSRVDHRHNFSPYFYLTYLRKSTVISPDPRFYYASNEDSTGSISTANIFDSIYTIFQSMTRCYIRTFDQGRALSYLPFISQALPMLLITVRYGATKLPLCMLLLTITFVTFNKVITGQYFLWYIMLVPVSVPNILETFRPEPKYLFGLLFCILVYVAALCNWLYWAYLLELKGQNAFYFVWGSSLLFFVSNILILGCIIRITN